VKVTRDLTENKKAQDEIVRQKENLETQNIELQRANKELESFTYISSHDLQEPLRKIQTFSSRILSEESGHLSEKGKNYFLRIDDAANRMQMLIADLLAYSRTTTAEQTFETVNLNHIVEDVINEFREVIAEKNATIETGPLCDVPVIPFQIRQMMHNLIGNALKFSKDHSAPHIRIQSEKINLRRQIGENHLPEKEYCHIRMSDNGIGFEPQYKDRIFELFQRLNHKAKYEGTGIGLAIVKRVVENHDGIITASAELNKGATFDIYIPTSRAKS